MKIYYRNSTLLEQMTDAIRDSKKPIDYFELTVEELNANYSNLDRSTGKDNKTSYSYKGIPVKVKQ
jgi:hypothetical protein